MTENELDHNCSIQNFSDVNCNVSKMTYLTEFDSLIKVAMSHKNWKTDRLQTVTILMPPT